MTSGTETIGFIGLGLMGHGMARNIVEKGYPLAVMAHRNRAPIDDLVGRGVTFTRYDGMEQDDRGAWTAPGGARIAWFQDPDGNTLSLQTTT
jgi:prephenate dehydrogenase